MVTARFWPRRRHSDRGFAYLWTLLLVAMLALTLVAAADIEATAVRRDREKELLFIGRQFRLAIARYHGVNGQGGKREYPASLDDLLRDDRVSSVRRHLRKLYVDPMTGKTDWGTVRVAGRIVGVHSLSEKRPIKQDGFEALWELMAG